MQESYIFTLVVNQKKSIAGVAGANRCGAILFIVIRLQRDVFTRFVVAGRSLMYVPVLWWRGVWRCAYPFWVDGSSAFAAFADLIYFVHLM